MKKTFLLMTSLILSVASYADSLDSLYHAIDEAISHAGDFMYRKQQQLAYLQREAAHAANTETRYNATMNLYEAYRSFRNDSAITCLNRCIKMAEEMGRTDLKADCCNKMGQQQSAAGFYSEAMNYLQQVPGQELKGELLNDHYYAMCHLYGEMGYYTQDDQIRKKYYRMSVRYRDSLLSVIPHNTERYLSCIESRYFNDHNYKAALETNDKRLKITAPGSHEYAIVSFYRAQDYGGLGKQTEQKYWLAQSALSDIRNCVMDQAALWSLADILNREGDIERSHRYVEYSWKCTSYFSAHVRSWLVSPVLTMINDKYKEKINRTNTHLWILVAIVSLFALCMAAMYIYVSRKRKQLAIARNELKEYNNRLTAQSRQLSDANAHLSALNTQLTCLNGQLSLSNRVKEEYIGKFFTLCSEYIDKMDNFRIKVNRKMKARQFDDLMRISQNDQMREDELAVLFSNFDTIFLHIFPNFLSDFDALLKPEHRTHHANGNKLTTDARIFALIRLGIDDSSKIAEFLHYTPNTIYNYRSRMKSKAMNPNCFESDIKRIESKSV